MNHFFVWSISTAENVMVGNESVYENDTSIAKY